MYFLNYTLHLYAEIQHNCLQKFYILQNCYWHIHFQPEFHKSIL
jgi:hypothetical protein